MIFLTEHFVKKKFTLPLKSLIMTKVTHVMCVCVVLTSLLCIHAHTLMIWKCPVALAVHLQWSVRGGS